MKRLGFFVVLALVTSFSLATFQAPVSVHAQNPPTTQPADYSQKKAQGLSDINAQISYLQQRVSNPALMQTWGGASDPRWQAYVTANARLITTIQSAIVNYNTNFDAAQQRGANPDASYMAALLSVITVINNGATTFVGGPIRQDIDNINRTLNNLVDALRQTANASGDPALQSAAQQTYNQVAAARAEQSNTPAGKCTSLLNATFLDCIDVAVSWIIKNTFLQIAGFLLWATASLLNFVIQKGILEFAIWAPDTLYPIWVIIRQIVSLFVVFAGLWLGFMYIIGKGEEFKKYIPWIVMFALFVNFSYPLTRSLIDVSNVVALNVYASTVGTGALTTTDFTNGGPGSLIVSKMGLGGLIVSATKVNSATGATTPKDMFEQINSVPGALMAVAFVGYSAWVFFMATALLIARTAVLVFLIVASPLLFVDSIIPKLGPKAAEMRQLFFSQLVVAPIFMIMLALTLKFLDIFSGNFGGGAAVGTISGTSTIIQFFNILMMLIMLQITLKVTKNVSGSVGEFATKTIGQVGGFAAGGALMGSGMIARGTIGRVAQRASESRWVTDNKNSFVGRRVYNLSNAVANSTFDLRNNSFVKTKTDKIGLNMGMGTKMGWREYKTKRDDEYNKRASSELSDIKTYYTEDVKDGKGNIIHKKGDVREEGVRARQRYIERETTTSGLRGMYNRANRVVTDRSPLKGKDSLQETLYKAEQEGRKEADEFYKKQQANIVAYAEADGKQRAKLFDSVNEVVDKTTKDKLRAIDEYSSIDTKAADGIERKVQALIKLNDSDTAMEVIKKGKLGDEKDFEEFIAKIKESNEKLQQEKSLLNATDDKEKIKEINGKIRDNYNKQADEIIRRDVEKETIEAAYKARMNGKDLPKEEVRTPISSKDWKTTLEALQADERAADIPAVQRKATAQQRMEQFNNPDIDITNPNQGQQGSQEQNLTLESKESADARVSAGNMTLSDNTAQSAPRPTPAPRPATPPQPTPAPRPQTNVEQSQLMTQNVIETARNTSLLEVRRARMARNAANDEDPTPPTTPSGGQARPSAPPSTSAQGSPQVSSRATASNDASNTPQTAGNPGDLRTGRGESSNDDQFRKAA